MIFLFNTIDHIEWCAPKKKKMPYGSVSGSKYGPGRRDHIASLARQEEVEMFCGYVTTLLELLI